MQRRSSLILMGHANILMSWNSGEMKYFPAMLCAEDSLLNIIRE